MSLWVESLVLMSALGAFLIFGVWIGVTLLAVALIAMVAFTNSARRDW